MGFLTRPLLGPIPGWVFISGMLLLGFAFVGGAIWTLRGGGTIGQAIPKIRFLDIAFQSTPVGAEVYVVGSNEYLGRTPFRRKVEFRDDRTSFVVFRLSGYLETTKEVRPEWSGEVTLQPQPLPRLSLPTPHSPIITSVEAPGQPVKRAERDPDPFENVKPNKPHGRPHSKGAARDKVGDPFDRMAAPTDGRKQSPFR